jgi:hypothetical protein
MHFAFQHIIPEAVVTADGEPGTVIRCRGHAGGQEERYYNEQQNLLHYDIPPKK